MFSSIERSLVLVLTVLLVSAAVRAQLTYDALMVGTRDSADTDRFYVVTGANQPVLVTGWGPAPFSERAFCVDDVTGDVLIVGADGMPYRVTIADSGAVSAQVPLQAFPPNTPAIREVIDVHQDQSGGLVAVLQHFINPPVVPYTIYRAGFSPTGSVTSADATTIFTGFSATSPGSVNLTDLASDRQGRLFLVGGGGGVLQSGSRIDAYVSDFNGGASTSPNVGHSEPIDAAAVDLSDNLVLGVFSPLGNIDLGGGTFITVGAAGAGIPQVRDIQITDDGSLYCAIQDSSSSRVIRRNG
ncbi:MAG: hypothetical protein KDA28_11360, partial [Phycisphaerales bacterium]|nr:hypothetical protein [Phycisphaerales bacterium]